MQKFLRRYAGREASTSGRRYRSGAGTCQCRVWTLGVDSGCPLPWLFEVRREAVTRLVARHYMVHMS